MGGGTAGCILAARLSEGGSHRVTLLEAGPPDHDRWIHIPAGYARLMKTRQFDWGYATEAEPELDGRSIVWPRGRVLGGSGSVNGLVFLRGSPHDYDRWAQSGARGWAWADVLPTFRALECWAGSAGETRGRDGPVPVSEPRRLSPGAAAFVAACEAAGFPRVADINDGATEGAGPVQMNVRRGRRVSTAQAYLRPARSRPNLQVITGLTARRIVLGDGRATGVEVDGPAGRQIFTAAREIVLCAGAIGSPHLLMLSGVGDGAMLAEAGIPTTLHCPGVGQNLQDHLIARLVFRTKAAGTLNEIRASTLRSAATGLEYLTRRSGPLAVGATEATLFARCTPGAEEAELQFQFINFSLAPAPGYVLARHPGMMMNWNQCRPDSRGYLRVRSPDPADRPAIHANYLSAPADQHAAVAGARLGQRIARTSPFADLVEEELAPSRHEATSDEALLAFVRRTATTVYHPCGTCRMGSDNAAVLDPQLRVRGLAGLRVADASAFPLVPSTNIQPAVMMLAERAARFMQQPN